MVSLIKNQILKHLSRYTKNLSPDKINLSTLTGEGELSSLELDEIVLTDLLELPTWLRLTSAWCNKVAFRVRWTKLRSVPIYISLDEVHIEVETCEELRSLSAHQGLSSLGAPTRYNYISKVIDGITISVNTVVIKFRSPAFIASVQIIKILVESRSPEWESVELQHTRIKDSSKGQVLIFKELKWESMRLEARSTKDANLPPLRLLTNRALCRITMKKRTSDCFLMGSKLLLILDDLLWVLTDSQLKAVLHFAESLSGLIQKSAETTRIKKAARKLEVLPEYQAQLSQQTRGVESTSKNQLFASCDVIETSYHFWVRKLDLNLSDDSGDGRSCHQFLCNGSSVHVQVFSLQIDFYPYHLAAADRTHWARYNPACSPHFQWLSTAHVSFKNSLMQLIDRSTASPARPPSVNSNSSGDGRRSTQPKEVSVKEYIQSHLAKVMTSCLVLRVEDFIVHRVTPDERQGPREFIKGDRDRHTFPSDVTLHAEFTYYYYPEDIPFPLPPPKLYVQVNPILVTFDVLTVLWCNSFAMNLHKSLQESKQESPNMDYLDVKLEAIMPRLVFEAGSDPPYGQRDRPKSLHIQVSRALISNVRSADWSSKADLAKCINASQLGSLFYGNEFPAKPTDFKVVSDKFLNHVQGKDNIRPCVTSLPTGSIQEFVSSLSKTLLWTEARDVWCINLEPLWGDFYGARGVALNKPVPFLDAFPLNVWVHLDLKQRHAHTPKIHALAYITNLVSLQLNHYQLLFLLKLSDDITELVTILGMDSDRITRGETSSVVVGAVLPQLELTLVMPAQGAKENSGADAESVVPDSSSIADDVITMQSHQSHQSIIQWNQVIATSLDSPVGPVPFRKGDPVVSGPARPDSLPFDHEKPDTVKQNIGSLFGFNQMKKGFSNISNMIDAVVKPVTDDISDSFSIRSEGSSDSENYNVRLRLNPADAMFRVDDYDLTSGVVEFANEVLENDDNLSGPTLSVTTPSENPSHASSYKRRDLISVATIKLGQVEFIQQSQGFNSVVKVQTSNIAIEDCPSIPWDEFQNKFSTRSRGWSEVCEQPAERPKVKLRFEHGVTVGNPKTWPGPRNNTWFRDLLTVNLSGINLTLNASTMAAVAEFVVDDTVSPPLPMDINMENIMITLNDDRSSNFSSIDGSPLSLTVTKLHAARNKEGMFVVEPQTSLPGSSLSSQELTDLKTENEQLRQRLAAMERLNEENHYLRKCEEETHLLRSCLNEVQDKLNTVLQEKQSLLDMVRGLQLAKGDSRQHSSKR